MMRVVKALAVALACLTTAPQAQAGDVVVELYTSQGCSSCPPADALLGQLAQEDGVLALALHVDYWDYLGWRDIFARPENAQRQYAYRERAQKRTVYTPQMVVNGQHLLVGGREKQVRAAIRKAGAKAARADVVLTSMGDMLKGVIEPRGPKGPPATVWVVTYDSPPPVPIRRGENKGRSISYHNVTRSWMRLGSWDGAAQVEFSAPLPQGAKGVAVILQEGDVGEIVGAAKIEFGTN